MRAPLTLISRGRGIAWTHYGDFNAYPFHFSPFVFTPAAANEHQTDQRWGYRDPLGSTSIATIQQGRKKEEA